MILDLGIVGGTYSTTDTDRGACPHVAPTAHFQMSGPGGYGSDGSVLELSQPSNVNLSASGTERDKPIVSYAWYIGGNTEQGFATSIFIDAVGSTGVSLTVTDELGLSSIADSAIFLTEPAPPGGPSSGGANPPGGGGQTACTDWEISFDGGVTWQFLGTTC